MNSAQKKIQILLALMRNKILVKKLINLKSHRMSLTIQWQILQSNLNKNKQESQNFKLILNQFNKNLMILQHKKKVLKQNYYLKLQI